MLPDHVHHPLNTSMHQEITRHVTKVVTGLNAETHVYIHAVGVLMMDSELWK